MTTAWYIALSVLLVTATILVIMSATGHEARPPAPSAESLKTQGTHEVKTICPYCGVGCGISLFTQNGEVVAATGDAEHPINEGSLCAKGAAVLNLRQVSGDQGEAAPNPRRATTVLYRAPGSSAWQERSWDWAISEIAKRYKTTRDATFEHKDGQGATVNRTFGIGHIGSAALDNEENYLLQKLHRACGVVRIEHHARL